MRGYIHAQSIGRVGELPPSEEKEESHAEASPSVMDD
jgi:hypothetical protein